MHPYFTLALAICAEVAATSALKASSGFTQFWPTTAVFAGYGSAFYLLSRVLEALPIGVTYAIWSGLGIVLVTLLAIPLYRQVPDAGALSGIALIVAGVVVIHLYSDLGST